MNMSFNSSLINIKKRVCNLNIRISNLVQKPYSNLYLLSESAPWSISWDMEELSNIAKKIGIKVRKLSNPKIIRSQSIFAGSHFQLRKMTGIMGKNRVATAYFHGRPGEGIEEFDQIYEYICQHHRSIERIQVTHKEMEHIVLSTNIDPKKIFLIPIGINLDYFSLQTPGTKKAARIKLNIPQDAVVVGSFQKDGNGWGEGREPKLIKGPDIFLKTIKNLRKKIPELFVLLSGPARGYVKTGLKKLGVPYRHCYLQHYPDISELYHALDAYIVSSRQEGGPKSVLESMASGVPLITTKVGQATDMVKHGENGWIVDVEDVESLAYWAQFALENSLSINNIISFGRRTAEENSYTSQLNLWREFMKDFVQINPCESVT